jgi:hypothetical protein
MFRTLDLNQWEASRVLIHFLANGLCREGIVYACVCVRVSACACVVFGESGGTPLCLSEQSMCLCHCACGVSVEGNR